MGVNMKKFIILFISICFILFTGCSTSNYELKADAAQLNCMEEQEEIMYMDFNQLIGFDENNIYVAKLEDNWNFYRYERDQKQWNQIPYSFAGDYILLETQLKMVNC